MVNPYTVPTFAIASPTARKGQSTWFFLLQNLHLMYMEVRKMQRKRAKMDIIHWIKWKIGHWRLTLHESTGVTTANSTYRNPKCKSVKMGDRLQVLLLRGAFLPQNSHYNPIVNGIVPFLMLKWPKKGSGWLILGKPVRTKMDEFFENFRKGGGSFPIQKFLLQFFLH